MKCSSYFTSTSWRRNKWYWHKIIFYIKIERWNEMLQYKQPFLNSLLLIDNNWTLPPSVFWIIHKLSSIWHDSSWITVDVLSIISRFSSCIVVGDSCLCITSCIPIGVNPGPWGPETIQAIRYPIYKNSLYAFIRYTDPLSFNNVLHGMTSSLSGHADSAHCLPP